MAVQNGSRKDALAIEKIQETFLRAKEKSQGAPVVKYDATQAYTDTMNIFTRVMKQSTKCKNVIKVGSVMLEEALKTLPLHRAAAVIRLSLDLGIKKIFQ